MFRAALQRVIWHVGQALERQQDVGVALAGVLTRGAKKAAQQVRVGDVIVRDGRLLRVSKFTWMHGQARAQGFITLESVDVKAGTRTSSKHKVSDTVDLAELKSRTLQVLYVEGNSVHLLDNESYEQYQVEQGLFGDKKKWLQPGLDVDVSFDTAGELVTGTVPLKVAVKVLDAPKAVIKDDGSGSNRHVLLEGGVTVMAPSHVHTGDTIVINTDTMAYISRAESVASK